MARHKITIEARGGVRVNGPLEINITNGATFSSPLAVEVSKEAQFKIEDKLVRFNARHDFAFVVTLWVDSGDDRLGLSVGMSGGRFKIVGDKDTTEVLGEGNYTHILE